MDEFQYPRIKIARDLRSFLCLNLLPVVVRLKEHCTRWKTLPLNLFGRINILKMIYRSKFNNMFRNCPVWHPSSFIKDLDGCIGSFLWQGSPSPLARSTLQLPVSCSGLALPNLLVYYWAAVLVTVRWWFQQYRSNAAVCLESAILGSLKELGNLVYRGLRAYPTLPGTTKVTLHV